MGTDNLESDIKARLQDAGIDPSKIRKNGVIGVDHILTASPEYFRPNGEPEGEYNQKRYDAWKEKSLKWLQDRYGKNLVSFVIHADEKTPHGHAVIVPIHTDPTKRQPTNLRAREYFSGAKKLSEMQDSYHEALKGLGLKRGVRGSKARHQSVKRFYGNINQEIENPAIEIAAPSIKDKLNPQEFAKKEVLKASKSFSQIISSLKDNLVYEEQKNAQNKAHKARTEKPLIRLAKYDKELSGLTKEQKQAAVKFGALKTKKLLKETKDKPSKSEIER